MAEKTDEQVLRDGVAVARGAIVDQLRKDPNALADPLDAAVFSAIINLETFRRMETHSRDLVRLTRALVGFSFVLAALTVVLVWRTFW